MPIYRINGHNLLFAHVPKTGGTSLERALKSVSSGQQFYYRDNHPLLPCSPQHFHGELLDLLFDPTFFTHKFLVVRNPFKRFESEYNWSVRHGETIAFNDWAISALDQREKDPFHLDNHLRPQTEFVLKDGTIHRMEDGLEAVLQTALAAVGFEGAMPTLEFANRVNRRDIIASPGVVERLRQVYAADFETFGYDPGHYPGAMSAD